MTWHEYKSDIFLTFEIFRNYLVTLGKSYTENCISRN